MTGWYTPHRVVCQACAAAVEDMDTRGKLRAGESVFVTDDSPPGYVPDPSQMPRFSAEPDDRMQEG